MAQAGILFDNYKPWKLLVPVINVVVRIIV
jgi:hypothetical protein